jgi:hypothetical protein
LHWNLGQACEREKLKNLNSSWKSEYYQNCWIEPWPIITHFIMFQKHFREDSGVRTIVRQIQLQPRRRKIITSKFKQVITKNQTILEWTVCNSVSQNIPRLLKSSILNDETSTANADNHICICQCGQMSKCRYRPQTLKKRKLTRTLNSKNMLARMCLASWENFSRDETARGA